MVAATGAESEAELPYAGLLTLLRPVLGCAAALPDVQRRALALGPPVPAGRRGRHVRGERDG